VGKVNFTSSVYTERDIWNGGALRGNPTASLPTAVTRAKISASSGSLRYTLPPLEKVPPRVKPRGAPVMGVVRRNRERELGLDRRETG
jgi:hypothetical protein